MKYLSHVLLAALLHLVVIEAQAVKWDPEEFLGALSNDPQVENHIRSVNRDRLYVKQLGQMRTPEARTALLRIAYARGEDKFGPLTRREAAQRFISASDHKTAGRALLVAQDAEVVDLGLVALIRQPVDAELLVKLGELAVSETALLRSKVAFVLREDPNVSFSEQKAKILLRSMESILQCSDSTNLLSLGDNVFSVKHSLAEFSLSIQASALGTLTDLTRAFWAEQTLPTAGLAREFMVLGQVKAGNDALREEARAIVKGSASLTARFEALHILMWTPTKEDIEATRWVAEHDNFKTTAWAGYFNMPNSEQSIRNKPDAQRQVYMMRFLAAHELRLKGL